jgi:hypothetical protein
VRHVGVRREGECAPWLESAVAVDRAQEWTVKTDELVDMLSTNVEPVDSRRASRRLAAAVVIGIAIAACLMAIALGLRTDLMRAGALSSLCLKLLFTGVVVVLASVALNKVMRPGGERNVPLIAILLPFIGIIMLAITTLALAPGSHWQAMLLGNQWLECLVSIPLIAVVPFALVTWAVRQAAPTDLRRAGALVGLIAGSVSATGYALHCTDDSVAFVALWYGATIALCTLVGFKLGPRLLRW